MRVIVGLGNPGRKYARTRHNVGYMVIGMLARLWHIGLKERQSHAELGRGWARGAEVLLVRPLTFMNLSGEAVAPLAARCGRESLIIVHDDLDLEPGRLRVRARGSSGGHRGIQSIIAALGSDEFMRVKIGIGRPPPDMATNDYVLLPPGEDEPTLSQAMQRAVEAIEGLLTSTVDEVMNSFNR